MAYLNRGDRVRFTAGKLGTMLDPGEGRFADVVVESGDTGAYYDVHPTLDGWHLCTVDVDGSTYYVPVHPAHFARLGIVERGERGSEAELMADLAEELGEDPEMEVTEDEVRRLRAAGYNEHGGRLPAGVIEAERKAREEAGDA